MASKFVMTSALSVLLAAGAAQAQFSYQMDEISTESYAFTNVRWDGNARVATPLFGNTILTGSDYLLETRTELSNTYSLDTTAYPSIDMIEVSSMIAGQAASDRFELSWDTSSQAQFADAINPASADLVLAPFQTGDPSGVGIQFDEDTVIRVSVEVELGGLIGRNIPEGANDIDNFAYANFSGSALVNPFSVGAGVPTDFVGALTFDLSVAAGSELNLQYGINNRQEEDAITDTSLRSWNQINRGSIVIEVIPAPSSLALLGLGGLVGVRRRR